MAEPIVTQESVDEIIKYLEKIASRLKNLEDEATKLDTTIESFDSKKQVLSKALITSVENIKKEMVEVKKEALSSQKIIIGMIGNLKSVVKKDEFERLERKIDAWSPEKLVSRREVRRLIENANA